MILLTDDSAGSAGWARSAPAAAVTREESAAAPSDQLTAVTEAAGWPALLHS